MTAFTIAQIREALAGQLKQKLERQTTVRPYPPRVAGPSIVILHRDSPEYHARYRATAIVHLWVEVDAGAGDEESSWRRLDDFLSAGVGNNSSVVDAIEANHTLGLPGCLCHIPTDTGFQLDETSPVARIPVDVSIPK